MGVRYRWRILRNLLILAALALLIWWAEGYPLPTLEMELHRWERQTLQEESEAVWSCDGLREADRDLLVCVSANTVTAACHRYSYFSWPRNRTRATLIGLPDWTRYFYEDVSLFVPSLLAVDPPAGAERARLTLELSLEEPAYREVYEMEGERQDSIFLFQVKHHHYVYWTGQPYIEEGEPGWEEQEAASELEYIEDSALTAFVNACYRRDTLEYYPWHLEFFDGAGNLLEEQFSEAFQSSND